MRDDHCMKKASAASLFPSSVSRRSFLGRSGASIAAAVAAIDMPALLGGQETADIDSDADDSTLSGPVNGRARRRRSFEIRIRAAKEEHRLPIPAQIANGDEDLYPNRIGSFSKGLPHNAIGEVQAAAYDSLLIAAQSGDPSDFANIPLGGNTKLVSPQAGLCFSLEGTDSGQLTCPPAPALASAERASEMVEDYWMALARDIPFSQYGNEPN